MIKNFKIYSDFNDDEKYAYCTYELYRNRGQHKECFRIELLFTDVSTGLQDFKPDMPVYEVRLSQIIQSKRLKTDRDPDPVVFAFVSRGYDQHTILDFIGDSPEHRDFLTQVGIHD